ncbi:MAG: single-stranded DNA-binding protein [Oscillospiraceae bacterium]
MSFNKVILMGRITHDLELRTTPNGISVCHFQMAVDRRYQTKGEERKSDFIRVTAWRQTAEFITRYFRKGSMILVEGELQTSSYTDKNGNNVNAMEVVVDQASFTGEKTNNPQGGTGSYGNAGGYQQNGYNNGGNGGYNNGYAQGNGGYGAPQGAPAPMQQPAPQTAPQQPAGNGGAPADFKGATDDNYPF